MTLPQILRVLWARKSAVLLCALLLLGLAAAVSLMLPRTYKATAEVLINLNKKSSFDENVAPHEALAKEVATQSDVLESSRVAGVVAQMLKMDQDPKWKSEWRDATEGRGQISNWLGNKLLEDLVVRADSDAAIIRVSYGSSDPREAAEVANSFVQVYLNEARDIKLNPALQDKEFLTERVNQAREVLVGAKKRLTSYLTKNDILDPTGKYDLENERLTELSQQLLIAEEAAAEANSRSGRNSGSSQNVLSNPVVQSLRQSVAQADAELAQMSRQYGSNHPTYRAQVRLVGTLRSKMNAEIGRQRGAQKNEAQIANAKVTKIKTLREQQRSKVIAMGEHRDAVEIMNTEITQAEDALKVLADENSITDVSGQINASLLAAAIEPGEADSPKVMLNTAIGGLLGALIGCIFALSRESSRPQIRTVQDLMDGFDLPVLVSLPNGDAKGKGGRNSGGGGGRALPQLSHLGPSAAPRLENARS